jgi:hypothetical protein
MTTQRGGFARLGETVELKALVKKYTPSKAHLRLIEQAVAIGENPDAVEKAYLARQLVLCTLPHSNPGDKQIYVRKCGDFLLSITPHIDAKTEKSLGFPYGILPRLFLFYITTEAVTKRTREVFLGKSFSEFMQKIGVNPSTGGGPRSDRKRLLRELQKFCRAKFSVDYVGNNKKIPDPWQDTQIASMGKGVLWWDTNSPEQLSLFESTFVLSEEFYKGLIECPVPFDFRAIKALKRSSMALDMYCWACYTAFLIVKRGSGPQKIYWAQLRKQFGADYDRNDHFIEKARPALRKVAAVYPGLVIDFKEKGCDHFSIFANRLAVPEQKKEELVHGETVGLER